MERLNASMEEQVTRNRSSRHLETVETAQGRKSINSEQLPRLASLYKVVDIAVDWTCGIDDVSLRQALSKSLGSDSFQRGGKTNGFRKPCCLQSQATF